MEYLVHLREIKNLFFTNRRCVIDFVDKVTFNLTLNWKLYDKKISSFVN